MEKYCDVQGYALNKLLPKECCHIDIRVLILKIWLLQMKHTDNLLCTGTFQVTKNTILLMKT